jgi:hypothetical protein
VGDILIFEERFSPEAGLPANPSHRYAVRLTYVNPEAKLTEGGFRCGSAASLQDPLTKEYYVEIAWHPQDALPFPLCLSAQINGKLQEVSFAWGNVVLADAGMTIAGRDLEPPAIPESGRYRPRLPSRQLTYRVPYDDVLARQQPAQKSIEQDPRLALDNPPGRTSLAYRLGTHSSFLERMLNRLYRQTIPDGPNRGRQPLTALTTRRPDDPTLALLDAWAVVADVLTFYRKFRKKKRKNRGRSLYQRGIQVFCLSPFVPM